MGLVIADTNIALYILKALHEVQPYLHHDFAISDETDLLTADKDFKRIKKLSATIIAL